MIVRAINKAIKPLGYKIVNDDDFFAYTGTPFANTGDFVLHKYTKEDGTFDYGAYKKIQEDGNKRKIDGVWVIEENIKFLSHYLDERMDNVSSGICHGTRRGKEQEWFRKYLQNNNTDVFGTELSETATQFPNTIQWDFHEVKDEWNEAFDFIYSNSFDHSYDPEKCLNAWMSCIKPGGLCIIEHTDAHSPKGANELDPFGAHLMQMPLLVARWGEGRFSIREILKAPKKNGNVEYVAFLVIQKH